MIPYINRFHGHNSLTYVYKNGQTVRSRSIILRYIKNTHRKNSRIAVVVSKKVFKSAVKRNRVRRRLYEYIRLRLDYLDDIYDIVFIVNSGDIINATHQDVVDQINQVIDQAQINKK